MVVSRRLENNASSAENSLLCLKLVKANKQQKNSWNSEGTKITIFRETSPKKSSDRDHNVLEEKNFRTNRNQIAAEEGSINICSKFKGSVCQQHLPKKKGRWPVPPNNKPKKIEQFYSLFLFQKRKLETGQNFVKTKQSDGKTRPTGCVFQCFSTHRHEEKCKVSEGVQPLRNPMSMLWSRSMPMNFHEVTEDSHSITAENNHQAYILHQWHLDKL